METRTVSAYLFVPTAWKGFEDKDFKPLETTATERLAGYQEDLAKFGKISLTLLDNGTAYKSRVMPATGLRYKVELTVPEYWSKQMAQVLANATVIDYYNHKPFSF